MKLAVIGTGRIVHEALSAMKDLIEEGRSAKSSPGSMGSDRFLRISTNFCTRAGRTQFTSAL